MHIWKTFLGGTFLGAAALGAVSSFFGLGNTPTVSMGALIPAISIGDVIEMLGSFCVGLVAIAIVKNRERREARRVGTH